MLCNFLHHRKAFMDFSNFPIEKVQSLCLVKVFSKSYKIAIGNI